MRRLAVQGLSPFRAHKSGRTDEFLTSSWENTENITAATLSACTSVRLGPVNSLRLFSTTPENRSRTKSQWLFLFHRLIILGRGVTDRDKQTAEVQTILAETTP